METDKSLSQNEYFFKIANTIQARLRSNTALIWNRKSLLEANSYIPGFQLETQSANQTTVSITHLESPNSSLIPTPSEINISANWHGQVPLDFFHLLYSASRIQLLQQHIYSVHSACTGKSPDKHYLIVGHSGAGKTTALLDLIQNHHFTIFSGNKTTVVFDKSKMLATSGTRTISVRSEDTKLFPPNVGWLNFSDRSAAFWETQFYSPESPVNIAAIIIARLNSYTQEKALLSPLSALHKLYPFFLDTVNADAIVNNGKQVLTGTPPHNSQEILLQQLSQSLKQIPTFTLIGSLEYVSNSIATL